MPETIDLTLAIPTYGRSPKLATLLAGIATTPDEHDRFEVLVVVDDEDEAPLETASVLPRSIRFVGLTQPHRGPAAARNLALERARGRWVLFFDDDARVDGRTIPGHLARIRDDRDADQAYLGSVDWPPELLDSPWRRLLAGSSMLFFWDRMRTGQRYGYRHFWTSNLSVRTDAVRAVGGFREQFPRAMHEDIELGWRLQKRFGTRVFVDRAIRSWHDHPMSPEGYFRREHHSGQAAAVAREVNREFHDEIWSWVGDAAATLETLRRTFGAAARQVRSLLERWAVPGDHEPSPDEMQAASLAHLPLKRMAFCQGYLGRPFEDLWEPLAGHG